MSGATMTRTTTRRGLVAAVLSLILVVAGLTAAGAEPASAAAPVLTRSAPQALVTATAADFDPGNIISDENFFNGSAMSAGAIQNFLNSQVSSCRSGYTCLKDYRQTTWSRSADAMCNAYAGAPNETSATIIYKVGQACNVSQSVLIVLLQKEQSLITDSWPSQSQYTSATGFACPDTAPCDAEFSGFYNQVYKAAWQYKRYTNPAGTSAFFTWFPVGKYSAVRYHPNAACGSSPVLIKNKATAGLYYYTPYQPNAVAMSNLYGGQTDGCSSYGNRNFWRLYTDWFGDPRTGSNPHGAFDKALGVIGGVQVTGWAVDPNTADPTSIWVAIDGASSSYRADYQLDWLPVLYPTLGAKHGFSQVIGASPGTHTVCVSKANGVDLGCKSVTVPRDDRAAASLDVAQGVAGGIRISGWSVDKKSGAQTYLWVNVDGKGSAYKVDKRLSWTPNLYPNVGNLHGFDVTVPAAPGIREICVYGVQSLLIACKTVTVQPFETGKVESVTGVVGGIEVAGWSLDQRTKVSTYVWVDVDGAGRAVAANLPSNSAAAAFPALGKNHGYKTTIPAKPGSHRLCVTGTAGNTSYGCQQVTVPNNEVGNFDSVTAVMGKISVSGWSLDRTSSATTYVWAFIDGKSAGAIKADKPLGWIPVLYPKSGPNHGFAATFSASAGAHEVCLTGTKENVSYGCKTVTVPTSGAASLDGVTAGDRSVTVTGWSVDRLSKATTYVWVSIDGVGKPYKADKPLPWIDAYFPGVGANHGFAIDIPAGAGPREVCVTATFDNQNLGCRTVDVQSPGAANVDAVTGVAGGVRVQGWAVNRETTESTYLWVDVQGVGGFPVAADKPLAWIDSYFPGVGPNHGVDSVVKAPSGSRKVCVTATFDNRSLGCTTVTVP
ncbi:hypothetical protein [Herbiconiux flava]|uniref:Uncharacterized protein n=1 Tax=Herbiconiux flava TaxID=881268 RepID=A0A852SUP4_9MICO|nr:hypothetical protein [Herbiconiux flava]NYD72354.1 hypothetical protein [Herbiconiux flava]GLK17683.1 hypothetical protein GCM10017602_21650 [Herbiconiux flava]